MLNVLVLGSSGMAGHVITLHLERNDKLNVSNISHRKRINEKTVVMDVTNFNLLSKYLDETNPNFIINCVGVLNQFAEENKANAILLNGYLPHFLEEKYKNSTTKIIHISTDCVFSGKEGNYFEDSFRDGDTFYARSKAIGEIVNEKDLTFRTSIIGPDINESGIGLFNWFMKSTGVINGYANAYWTGVTTIELAKAIEAVIFSNLTGLYHLVPGNNINKYDLTNLFKNEFNREDVEIQRYENYSVNKSLINTRKDFNYAVPNYEEMILNMRLWIEYNRHLYPHYKF
ncbi:sugar nucleotide-binding protein [Clostridium swellfunianum]|uniref:sugar nucleotide-binding protein n=1 Tax=Clostridium swellfunianum TaxID=1367462 RepID=UPI00202EE05A|nr:sugar nucleotide-binding protein [Clostridium swellfunianum]MCM0647435.1 sugar nucleotide-binding protein [Clostridium swellfunianum]